MAYYINLIYSIFMFIIGTLFGSFFTLAIYRIPRKQDIVKTRSYCPTCKHKLGFFDCFPILSYVSTIGRCRYCKKPISIRYPLIEFASGMVFLLIYLICGFSWQSFALIACYIYLFLVIGVDIMKKKMTAEGKKEIENAKGKKTGAINIDIVIAIIVFVMFFVSTIYVTRNYSTTLVEYNRKSNALNICMNNINNAKFQSIATLTDSTGITEIDEISYNYAIQVLPYKKGENVELSNARVIVSTVSYMLDGKENSVSLKCVKVENNI
ncbi:MAG: prepilin peptidase [Clostridia bacterium]|nr:prepilin peptidase [Clostridia bacterium]